MKLRKRLPVILRRIAQTAFLVGFLVWIWNMKYPLQGFVNPRIFFNLDPLVMGLTAVAERVWLPGLVLALVVLALTLVFGRFFCGWFCPLGTLQDWTARLLGRYHPKAEPGPERLRWLKYGIVGVTAVLAVLGWQVVWFFDPLAIVVRAFSFNIFPWVNQAVDHTFAFALPLTGYFPPLERVYGFLQETVLDVSRPRFPHAGFVLVFFLAVLAAVLWRRRFWCRFLCPLGALLGLASRWAWYRRAARQCTTGCGVCRTRCRTGAIRADNTYASSECVMCFDCTASCVKGSGTFGFHRPAAQPTSTAPDGVPLTRGDFLMLAAGTVLAAQGCGSRPGGTAGMRTLLRPPAALPEREFVQRCVRCGNCMKVCLTNVLQPAVLESGWAGIWTPRLEPRIGYCEYLCNLCGQVCPTGALPALTVEQKKRTKLGTAYVDRGRCVPWVSGGECLVCEEHCPVPNKAIKIRSRLLPGGNVARCPEVDPDLCVGCAICENKCPIGPVRAIRVLPN